MPFGDVTKFHAKSCEREENTWVLGCAKTDSKVVQCKSPESNLDGVSRVRHTRNKHNRDQL